MTKMCYKVRDKVTGKYWNGEYRYSSFGDKGKTWTKKAGAENTVSYYIRHRAQWSNLSDRHSLPHEWEIVEIQLIEQEKTTHSMSDLIQYLAIKAEVEKIDRSAIYFLESMRAKKVLDKIEFIFALKPAEGSYYVDMERIIEARAQLRQLGVKTRTFREGNGYFGLMDREQAMKARLTLDVNKVIDLAAIRKQLGY